MYVLALTKANLLAKAIKDHQLNSKQIALLKP